jgi:hypothetical protein
MLDTGYVLSGDERAKFLWTPKALKMPSQNCNPLHRYISKGELTGLKQVLPLCL